MEKNPTFNGNVETVNGKDILFSVVHPKTYEKELWKGTITQSYRRKSLDGRVFIVQSQGLTLAIHETLSHGQTVSTEIQNITTIREQFITQLLNRYDYFPEIERD